jgi:hypothetical protein
VVVFGFRVLFVPCYVFCVWGFSAFCFLISVSVCERFAFVVSVCFSVRCSLDLGFGIRVRRCFCGRFDPRFGSVLVVLRCLVLRFGRWVF